MRSRTFYSLTKCSFYSIVDRAVRQGCIKAKRSFTGDIMKRDEKIHTFFCVQLSTLSTLFLGSEILPVSILWCHFGCHVILKRAASVNKMRDNISIDSKLTNWHKFYMRHTMRDIVIYIMCEICYFWTIVFRF